MSTATPSTTAAATTWAIDPAHSVVELAVKHMMFSTVKGRFANVAGTIVLDEANLGASSVTAEIDAASIDTGEPQRDGHLRSADFLDVDNFPTITFRSTGVVPQGRSRFVLVGDLTIRRRHPGGLARGRAGRQGRGPVGRPARRLRRDDGDQPQGVRADLESGARSRRRAGQRPGQDQPGDPGDAAGKLSRRRRHHRRQASQAGIGILTDS